MKGYKVFKEDWTCKGFQYAVGETYEIKEEPICCKVGFHFCEKLSDCFSYYRFDPNNKVAEVEAIGNIVSDDNEKCCTNKIHIVRELSWEEVLKLVNTGKENTGIGNSGDRNSGNRNTGDYNTGDWNTGNRNSGDRNTGIGNTGMRNTGDCNSGDFNTGDCNSGDFNTGSYNTGMRNTGDKNTGNNNTGNYNSGDFNTGYKNIGDRNTGNYNTGIRNTGYNNTGNWNTGCFNTGNRNTGWFNTINHNIMVFNKPTTLTYDEFIKIYRLDILNNYPHKIKFINEFKMSDIEKEEHPEYKTIGGYLKEYSNDEFKTIVQEWWDNLSNDNKQSIMDLPNFDPDIFYECTWIKSKLIL